MGGSGNGGGGRSSHNKEIPCEELKFNTQLSSPKEDVIVNIRPGMLLEVILSPTRTTCVVIIDGQIAGTIIHSNLNKLINCIVKGNVFYAKVRSVDGAKCAITVLHENEL